jgi:secreted PhoX family phosphatase
LEDDKKESKGKVSRRDFLKYSAGVAAVAAGAAATLGKVSLPLSENRPAASANQLSSEPIVVSVNGEELTVMSAQGEVKVRDSALAAAIAEKVR